MKIKKITIIALVLIIFILLSAVQSIQLNNLKEKLSGEKEAKISSSSKDSSTIASKTTASFNKGNLPQMVGGC